MEIYENEYRIIKVDLDTDISNYDEIKFSVKENKTDSDADAILSLSYLNGDIGIYDATNGYISIIINTINSDITVGSYFYDIQITDIDNSEVLTATEGNFILSRQVTRTTIRKPNGISGSITINGGYGNTDGNITILFEGTNNNYYYYLKAGETSYYKELPPDTYDLTCNAEDYTLDTISSVTVTVNAINTGNDFTLETELAGASGAVTLDAGGDVQNVLIEVKNSDGDILDSTKPDENGDYEIWVEAGTNDIIASAKKYDTSILSNIVFTAGSGNINTGNDITLNTIDTDWIKCSGDSGAYQGGYGYAEFPKDHYIEFNKYIKWSEDTFTAYLQETKIELSSGVPTVYVNLLVDGYDVNVFSHTFSDLIMKTDTEYTINFFINYEGNEEWKINCKIKYGEYETIADETQYISGSTLSWVKVLNNAWWGKINTGDIYIKEMYYTPTYLHLWDVTNIKGDIIQDMTHIRNRLDLIISNDMVKIT